METHKLYEVYTDEGVRKHTFAVEDAHLFQATLSPVDAVVLQSIRPEWQRFYTGSVSNRLNFRVEPFGRWESKLPAPVHSLVEAWRRGEKVEPFAFEAYVPACMFG